MEHIVSTSRPFARDIRIMLFFVFFALTIGAGSGLLQGTKSADARIAQSTQSASTITVSNIDDLFAGLEGQTYHYNPNTPQRLGGLPETTIRNMDGQLFYERRFPDTGWVIQYFPNIDGGRYRSMNGCDTNGVCTVDMWSRQMRGESGRRFFESLGVRFTNDFDSSQDYLGRGAPLQASTASTDQMTPAIQAYLNAHESTPQESSIQEDHTQREHTTAGSAPEASAQNSSSTQRDGDGIPGSREVGRNRCSTSYLRVLSDGTQQIRECYGTQNDVAKRVIHALTRCIAENTTQPRTTDALARTYTALLPRVQTAMCTDERSRLSNNTGGATRVAVVSENPRLVYPLFFDNIPERALQACEQELSDAIGLIGGRNGSATYRSTETRATNEDADSCAWKGAALCLSDPASPNDFTCKSKAQAAIEAMGSQGGSSNQLPQMIGGGGGALPQPVQQTRRQAQGECNNISCFVQNMLRNRMIQQTVGQLMSRLFTGGGGACPRGMVQAGQSSSDGRPTCAPEPQKLRPQCAMAANKKAVRAGEEVILKWKTRNAKSVSITGIGERVESDGERKVYPSETITYTLTARGDGGEVTCETTVSVNGAATGSTGAYPPALSCTPQEIEKDTPVTITWSCPAPANSSVGTHVQTNGLVQGTVTTSPAKSTEYRVACMQDGVEVGANVCAVTVGKPQYDIITYPSKAKAGERVRVSWGSVFMDRCRVQGPRGFDFSYTEAVVVTEPFAQDTDGTPAPAEYILSCITNYGAEVVKTATVEYQP